jgi:predicted nucleotidyltransferase
MKSIEEIKKILVDHLPEIRQKYKVKSLGIFGSYVRGQQKKNSDMDVLVEFDEPIGLFKFMDLEEYLQNILGIKIDLVSKKALKPRIGQFILNEVVYL